MITYRLSCIGALFLINSAKSLRLRRQAASSWYSSFEGKTTCSTNFNVHSGSSYRISLPPSIRAFNKTEFCVYMWQKSAFYLQPNESSFWITTTSLLLLPGGYWILDVLNNIESKSYNSKGCAQNQMHLISF